MRIFTEDEKRLLVRINNGQGKNLYSLIDPWIQGVSFTVDPNQNSLIILFEIQYVPQAELNNFIQNRLSEIQSIIIQVVNLIKLFEDKGYIFTFNNTPLPPFPFTFGQAAINLRSIPYRFPDNRISELFTKYSTGEIFVTPELGKFISDGFISREDVRANRQYRVTRKALKVTTIALIISIIALLMNMGFNMFRNSNNDQKVFIKNSEININRRGNYHIYHVEYFYLYKQKHRVK